MSEPEGLLYEHSERLKIRYKTSERLKIRCLTGDPFKALGIAIFGILVLRSGLGHQSQVIGDDFCSLHAQRLLLLQSVSGGVVAGGFPRFRVRKLSGSKLRSDRPSFLPGLHCSARSLAAGNSISASWTSSPR